MLALTIATENEAPSLQRDFVKQRLQVCTHDEENSFATCSEHAPSLIVCIHMHVLISFVTTCLQALTHLVRIARMQGQEEVALQVCMHIYIQTVQHLHTCTHISLSPACKYVYTSNHPTNIISIYTHTHHSTCGTTWT